MNIVEIEKPHTEVKLCINCKWMMQSEEANPKCRASEIRDLVTGEYYYYYCRTERQAQDIKSCGITGKNYEPNLS